VNFRAKLRRASPIYRHWTDTSKIGGTINGVRFKKEGPRDFVSVDDPLPPDAVSALVNHEQVELEVTTAPVCSVTVIEGDALDADDEADDQADIPGTEDGAEQSADPFAANYQAPGSIRDAKPEPMMRRPPGRPRTRF
jgi:hypothetical protein